MVGHIIEPAPDAAARDDAVLGRFLERIKNSL